MSQPVAVDSSAGPTLCLVGASDVTPFSMTPVERLRRTFARVGVDRLLGPLAALPLSGRVLLLRGDRLYDDALAKDMAERSDWILLDEQNRPVAANVDASIAAQTRALLETGASDAAAISALGLTPVNPSTLALSYRHKLRKRTPPFVIDLNEVSRGKAEWRLMMAAWKGVTDIVTKFVWPLPTLWVVRFCARRDISPNMVTLASLGFVLIALACFWYGWFALGLVAAWIMTFLDTVDGKLARVTLTSSTWGEIFDHGIDHVHPPIWWWAWWQGLQATYAASTGAGSLALIVVVGGYVLGRLQEGLFLWRFGIEMHAWQRLDSHFRLITARRNPNLLLLTGFTIAGAPQEGFLAVAIWTAVSIAFHFMRIGQAFAAKRQNGAIVSWLAVADPRSV